MRRVPWLALVMITACSQAAPTPEPTTQTTAPAEPTSTTSTAALAPAPAPDFDVIRCSSLTQLTGEIINPGAPQAGQTSEELMSALGRYGGSHPDTYGGIWLDGGVIVLAFTADLAAHVEPIRELVGNKTQVMLAETEFTRVQLKAIQASIPRSLSQPDGPLAGSGAALQLGVVAVSIEVLDEESVNAVTRFTGTEGICFEGADPADVVPDLPQVRSGDGWELILNRPRAGGPYRTGFAENTAQLETLWRTIDLPGEPPEFDFTDQVIIWFGPAVSSSCSDIRLTQVIFEEQTVYPEIVLTGGLQMCNMDANPHAYLVAVDRDRLPARPFVILLDPAACHRNSWSCEEERTIVE